MFSVPFIDMRQLSLRLTDDLAYLIEVRLERFKTDQVVHDETTIRVAERGVLRPGQMPKLLAVRRQMRQHLAQRQLAGRIQILPGRDETVPGISHHGKLE